ncbi:MAG: hypothetical protein KGH57_02260 [Candidatus Micrarchaeota archaeon]|nr:hypothetical protein [Candidatus Micrarchaeota archaeon]
MRAQLSLELLLYVALAGLSFAFAASAVETSSAKLGGSVVSFETGQFVDALNTAMLETGSFSGNFYVPRGLCDSEISGDRIAVGGGLLYFVMDVNASPSVFCPDGVNATLRISVRDERAYVTRG